MIFHLREYYILEELMDYELEQNTCYCPYFSVSSEHIHPRDSSKHVYPPLPPSLYTALRTGDILCYYMKRSVSSSVEATYC